jgi:hypothetical protein
MTVNELIKKLEGIKEAEGGDIEVFLSVKESESPANEAMVGRAEHMVDEDVYLGHCEDYHQCVVIE